MHLTINEFLENGGIKTFGDLVLTMADGVEKEWITFDESTFGSVIPIKVQKPGLMNFMLGVKETKKLCSGCSATNLICEIIEQPIHAKYLDTRPNRARFLNLDPRELEIFEDAIDSLRRGDADDCIRTFINNEIKLNFSDEIIKEAQTHYAILETYDNPLIDLPKMTKYNLNESIQAYREYGFWLKEQGL